MFNVFLYPFLSLARSLARFFSLCLPSCFLSLYLSISLYICTYVYISLGARQVERERAWGNGLGDGWQLLERRNLVWLQNSMFQVLLVQLIDWVMSYIIIVIHNSWHMWMDSCHIFKLPLSNMNGVMSHVATWCDCTQQCMRSCSWQICIESCHKYDMYDWNRTVSYIFRNSHYCSW